MNLLSRLGIEGFEKKMLMIIIVEKKWNGKKSWIYVDGLKKIVIFPFGMLCHYL